MSRDSSFRPTSKRRPRGPNPNMSDPHQLFDDTSAGPAAHGGEYTNHASPSLGIPAQVFLSDPMSHMAMSYGSSLASQGKEMVDMNINRFIPMTKLKYYFAVDTVYVGKKIGLLVFPYMHQDWEVRYQQDTPVAPRFDINAPDLYIPGVFHDESHGLHHVYSGGWFGTRNPEQLLPGDPRHAG
ncbi:hypothetical protein FKM82_026861 [Ascaphus truei]